MRWRRALVTSTTNRRSKARAPEAHPEGTVRGKEWEEGVGESDGHVAVAHRGHHVHGDEAHAEQRKVPVHALGEEPGPPLGGPAHRGHHAEDHGGGQQDQGDQSGRAGEVPQGLPAGGGHGQGTAFTGVPPSRGPAGTDRGSTGHPPTGRYRRSAPGGPAARRRRAIPRRPAHDHGGGRGGVGVDARSGGNRHGAPGAVDRSAGGRVDQVVGGSAVEGPVAAPDSGGGQATAVDGDGRLGVGIAADVSDPHAETAGGGCPATAMSPPSETRTPQPRRPAIS